MVDALIVSNIVLWVVVIILVTIVVALMRQIGVEAVPSLSGLAYRA